VNVPKPLWILSLPRTGSTWLHKLLSLDPACRTMKSWELKYPLALNECKGPTKKERFELVKKQHEILYKIAPRIRTIHFVSHNDPDECIMGFIDPCLVDWHAWGMLSLKKSYEAYINSSQATNSLTDKLYLNYAKVIKCILFQDNDDDPEFENEIEKEKKYGIAGKYASSVVAFEGKSSSETELYSLGTSRIQNKREHGYSHTVFKSPHHLLALQSTNNAFPESRYLWLHRDPVKVVGSCCSMNLTVLDYFSALYQDKHELGKRTLNRLANSVRVAVAARKQLERRGVEFVDVLYEDLKADSIGTIKRIYDEFNMHFSDEYAANLERFNLDAAILKAKNKNSTSSSTSTHAYAIEEFGLSESDVKDAFDDYIRLFPRIVEST